MNSSQTSLPSTYSFESAYSDNFRVEIPEPEGPPSLGYDIASKKRSIAIKSFSIVLVNGILPAALFYTLKFGTSVSRQNMINMVEIATTLTLFHWPWRLWQLLRRGGERATRNRRALTLDSFQWCFLIGVFPVAACCLIAGLNLSMRWYMFGPVSLFGLAAMQLVLTWFLTRIKFPLPIRMSSIEAGQPTRPAVYFLVEDITACDGAGGQVFRDRLNVRWLASLPFRLLLEDLTLYLGLGFLAQTGVQFIILLATDENVFVAVSTAVLWVWCGLSAFWAVLYTQRALQAEKLWWEEVCRRSRLGL